MYIIPSGAQRGFYRKIATVLLLVLLADFLFLNDAPAGWTIGLFAVAAMAGILLHNPGMLQIRQAKIICGLTAGLCLSAINNPSTLNIAFLALGLVSLAIADCGAWHRNAVLWAESIAQFTLSLIHKLYYDCRLWRSVAKCQPDSGKLGFILKGWLLPAGLAIVFVFLFVQANPIIDGWVASINLEKIAEALTFERFVFWMLCTAAAWGFIHPIAIELNRSSRHSDWRGVTDLFRQDAITRSLILFNLLFAVQTIMDGVFLLGGATLPQGVTFAGYAHRGAYPLVAAALLAGLFVLIAFRPGSDVLQTRTVKILVYVWIGQTILLVMSSIWRMVLYVEVYSLTYLRVAAFIWMGLIACGLAWIIARIIWQRSNLWLINANALTLLAVLYVCCFIPFGGLIAHYNTRHNLEIAGKGHMLDLGYLQRIGANALPALEWYQEHLPHADSNRAQYTLHVRNIIFSELRTMDWREWTWQHHRIKRQAARRLRPLVSKNVRSTISK